MTQDDVSRTAEEAADRAIGKLFLTLGVDLSDPKSVIAFQDDLRFLSNWRESAQAVKRKALLTAVGVLVAGTIGYLLLAMRGHP
jgi:hypothetical protein